MQNERPEIAGGFAAAGGTAADDVATGENEGKSGGLDGRGLEIVLILEKTLERGRKGERGEGQDGIWSFEGQRSVRGDVVHFDTVLLLPVIDRRRRRRRRFGREIGGSFIGGRTGVKVLLDRRIALFSLNGSDQVGSHFGDLFGIAVFVVDNYSEQQ